MTENIEKPIDENQMKMINSIYEIWKKYKNEEISFDDFIIWNNSFCYFCSDILNSIIASNKDNKGDMYDFCNVDILKNELNKLENNVSDLNNKNNVSIQNICYYIESKINVLEKLLSEKLYNLGWIKDVSFKDNHLIFIISPCLHIPYHIKNTLTNEEYKDYKNHCIDELNKKGFIFTDNKTFKNKLSYDSKNINIINDFFNEYLNKVSFIEYNIIFNNILGDIKLYCNIDVNLKKSIVEEKYNQINDKDNIISLGKYKITKKDNEIISKEIDELLNFISIGYYLDKNKNSFDDYNILYKDIISDCIFQYISSLSTIYKKLGINNNITNAFNEIYKDIRNINKKIYEYKDKIKNNLTDIKYKDVVDSFIYKFQAVMFLCLNSLVEIEITENDIFFNCCFSSNIEVIYLNLNKDDTDDSDDIEFQSNSNIPKFNTSLIKKVLLNNAKRFDIYNHRANNKSFCILLNNKNISVINKILDDLNCEIVELKSEKINYKIIIKSFKIKLNNLNSITKLIDDYLINKKNEILNNKEGIL